MNKAVILCGLVMLVIVVFTQIGWLSDGFYGLGVGSLPPGWLQAAAYGALFMFVVLFIKKKFS